MRSNNTSVASTGVSLNEMASSPDAIIYPADRKWHTILWNPGYPEAYSFGTGDYAIATSNFHYAFFQVLLEGVASTVAYEWELIGYHELIANGADYPINAPTKSHTDMPGYGFVKDFLSSDTAYTAGKAALNAFMSYAASPAASRTMSYVSGRPRIEF